MLLAPALAGAECGRPGAGKSAVTARRPYEGSGSTEGVLHPRWPIGRLQTGSSRMNAGRVCKMEGTKMEGSKNDSV
jgi:hypothetical protein